MNTFTKISIYFYGILEAVLPFFKNLRKNIRLKIWQKTRMTQAVDFIAKNGLENNRISPSGEVVAIRKHAQENFKGVHEFSAEELDYFAKMNPSRPVKRSDYVLIDGVYYPKENNE